MSCVLRYVSLIQLFLSLISCRHEKQFQKHHSKQVGKQKKEQPKLFQPDFQHMSGTKNTHIQGKAVGEQKTKKTQALWNTGKHRIIVGHCREMQISCIKTKWAWWTADTKSCWGNTREARWFGGAHSGIRAEQTSGTQDRCGKTGITKEIL